MGDSKSMWPDMARRKHHCNDNVMKDNYDCTAKPYSINDIQRGDNDGTARPARCQQASVGDERILLLLPCELMEGICESLDVQSLAWLAATCTDVRATIYYNERIWRLACERSTFYDASDRVHAWLARKHPLCIVDSGNDDDKKANSKATAAFWRWLIRACLVRILEPSDASSRTVGWHQDKDGKKFYGDWSESSLNGWGVRIDNDGCISAGQFLKGKRHGAGISRGKNRSVFECATFVNDDSEGWTTLDWPSGVRYEGNNVNGHFRGLGTYHWSNGSVYTGEFFDGKFCGHGDWIHASGNRYIGQWKADRKHGEGTYYYANDGKQHSIACERGTWLDGIPNGSVETFFRDGRILTSYRRNGTIDADMAVVLHQQGRTYTFRVTPGHPPLDDDERVRIDTISMRYANGDTLVGSFLCRGCDARTFALKRVLSFTCGYACPDARFAGRTFGSVDLRWDILHADSEYVFLPSTNQSPARPSSDSQPPFVDRDPASPPFVHTAPYFPPSGERAEFIAYMEANHSGWGALRKRFEV